MRVLRRVPFVLHHHALGPAHVTRTHGGSCTRRISSAIRYGKVDVDESIRVFSEYNLANQCIRTGKYDKAIPLYERIQEVISSTMGSDSSLSISISLRTAALHMSHGRYSKADSLLASKPYNTLPESAPDDVHIIHKLLQAVCNLMVVTNNSNNKKQTREAVDNNQTQSIVFADQAVALCEQSDNNIDILSTCYAIRGLCSYYAGDWEEAETFLQLAARWAQTPLEQLCCLSNLGVLSAQQSKFRVPASDATPASTSDSTDAPVVSGDDRDSSSNTSGPLLLQGCEEMRLYSVFQARSPFLPGLADRTQGDTPQVSHSGHGESGGSPLLREPCAQEALRYWQEALDLGARSPADVENGSAASAAAALCGVGGIGGTTQPVGGSRSSAQGSMTGLEDAVLFTSNKNSDSNKSHDSSSDSSDMWADEHFTTAYVTVLCNIAELYECAGDPTRKGEALSAAFKALEEHAAAKDRGAQAQTQGVASTSRGDGSGGGTGVGLELVTGRLLGLAAQTQLAAGQAVSAEGLFRAAADKLTDQRVGVDPRYGRERELLRGYYGLLLSKWDRRADSGEAMLAAAAEALAYHPSHPSRPSHLGHAPSALNMIFPALNV